MAAETPASTRPRKASRARRRPYTINHDKRWRPKDKRGTTCGYTFRGQTCTKKGAHYCAPRADRVVAFFSELLVHTKGPHKRKPFIPEPWQEHEILRPMFGEVLWSSEYDCYVRRYRIAYIVLARKNGKSEIAAGILLYLLIGDDEEAAEVYGAAADTKQAGKVFEPALRMVQLQPVLNKRLKHVRNARRLVDETMASHYEVITADAQGELGHNPHGFCLDEVLSQPDGSLWEAMTTAVGARLQEMLCAITTETNDPASFGADLIDEAERVQQDPARAPHIFAFVRKFPRTDEELAALHRIFPGHPDLPTSLDPWDEANWKWPNPALGAFKSLDAMRRQALEAKASPNKENGFRQFQLNQRVSQVTRFVPMDLWGSCTGEVAPNPEWLRPRLAGEKCWAGLDLSSKFDLTAWCLFFEDGSALWRFWVPESVVPTLDKATDDKFSLWVRDGWVTATDGDVIDYESIYAAIEEDNATFAIVDATYDKWCGEPVRQAIEDRTGLEMVESNTTFERMTQPMTEMLRLLKTRGITHYGNPVAAWCADNLEAKRPRDDPDRIRPVKPERNKTGKRIDGMPALFFAIDGSLAVDEAGAAADIF
ncbi:terminase large subunit [Streptomyces sp. DH37]|uniref:terminase large subunit n=1 Tax=Streptomyces sp. DH37 TaxID=3040122 RepID=UPI0024415384|nr:terminase TerL endonuclease subunit [Streptomyces sp. DH37]MDG9703802.1 terminase large subunit [Streptomyces sp. DH37]